MVIEGVTGGKPQEVRQAERRATGASRVDAAKAQPGQAAEKAASSTTQVSERSRAAIKAYRIASETKPDISRAQRVAQIKQQIADGAYRPDSMDVAASVLKSVVKGA